MVTVTKVCMALLFVLVSMLPVKTKHVLPLSSHRYPSHQSAIQTFIRTPLLMHEKNKRPTLYENHVLRKASIPIYIIKKRSPKTKQNKVLQVEKLFDRNGMIYLTEPKEKYNQLNEYFNKILNGKFKNKRRNSNGIQLHTKDMVAPKSVFNFSDLVL